MSAFLELLEIEQEYALISTADYNRDKSMYGRLQPESKDFYDKESQKELNLFNKDVTASLMSQLIKETKKVKSNTNVIKGWVVFFGILFIVNTILLLFFFDYN